MVTTYNKPNNTYLTTATGGTVTTAEQKDIVTKWVAALEPWETEVLNKVMSNDEFEQEVHQWGQSYRIKLDTTTTAAITAADTSVKVATGTGVQFKEGDVLAIYNAGTDGYPIESTKSVVTVTATPTTDTVATTAVANAHTTAAIVRLIGSSEKLNYEHSEAPRVRGERLFNYPQRFQAKMTADKRAQNMPTWEHESNPLLADFAEEMKRQKMLLQRAVFEGVRQAGDANTASRFGGLNQFLVTNKVNLSGNKIGVGDIDDILTDLWLETASADNKVLVMGMNEARILDTTIGDNRRADYKDDSVNRVIRQYHFRTGTFDVAPMREVPAGNIYVLDWNLIKLRPFKGLNWHVSGRDGADFAVDHDVKAISGDFTLEVTSEHAMARIYNFNNDLDQYPSA